jgi:tetratricopeptide (TPR) repeat protein
MESIAAAIQVYERAVQLAPRTPQYLISLGNAQGSSAIPNSSQQQESIKTLQRAVNLNPMDPFSHRALGVLYRQIGERALNSVTRNTEIHKAISSFRQVARLAPTNKYVYNDLGFCYFLLGDYKNAREFYEKSMKMHVKDDEAYMYMGEIQYTLNDLEGALQSYIKAVRIDRDNLEARRNIVSMLTLLGRKKEAISEGLESLKIAPRDLTLLRKLSSLYFSMGDYGSGLAFARRAYDATSAESRPGFDAYLEMLRNQAK